MSRQIEEMTKDLCDIECKGMKCESCDGYACEYRMLAEALYNKGYRRASEVAREIFEDIERVLDNYHSACLTVGAIEADSYYEDGLGDAIAELKKKYESEGGE